MRNFNVAEWKNLNPADDYSAGQGYSRASLLMKADPFCSIFNSEHNTALLNCFFSEAGMGTDHLTVHTVTQVEDCCSLVWSELPHGALFSEAFRQRITAILAQAIFPEDV